MMCGSMVDIQSVAAEIRRGKKEQDAKPVEICMGAPNYRIDLSRYWAEVHYILRTCGGDIAA